MPGLCVSASVPHVEADRADAWVRVDALLMLGLV